MRSIVVCIVVVLFMLLIQIVVFFTLVNKLNTVTVSYKVTEDQFLTAVDQSVFRFLDGVYTNRLPSLSGSSSAGLKSPRVEVVSDLATWVFPSGKSGCIIDGVHYGVGDFTPHGLVKYISSGKVFCSQSNEVVIVRGRIPPASPEADGSGPNNAAL